MSFHLTVDELRNSIVQLGTFPIRNLDGVKIIILRHITRLLCFINHSVVSLVVQPEDLDGAVRLIVGIDRVIDDFLYLCGHSDESVRALSPYLARKGVI